ncbi:helix-turn-helix domain-containing protein [Salicola sp. Rm-C-2C1-2]|uniref:helix-turn-helix transcriptional regulator n=1 Tax=Salicola sp. Rm-C-2C1-2 TaxID=3141321 RepID=UPI0032E3DB6F
MQQQTNQTYIQSATPDTTPDAQEVSSAPNDFTVTMPKLWNQKNLAAYLGKSTYWCERARWAGEGPKFVKIGRCIRYKPEDVLEWLEEQTRRSTTDNGGAA